MSKVVVKNLLLTSCNRREEASSSLASLFSLKIPPNSLQELSLINMSVEKLQPFLVQQTSIKKLHITGALGDCTFITNFKLTSLKLTGTTRNKLLSIIESQPNLISLTLVTNEEAFNDDEYGDFLFNKIVELRLLETLDISLNNVQKEIIPNLSQLKHLKKLTVTCSDSHFEGLVRTAIPTLECLNVTLSSPAWIDSVDLLARNIPNLKSLKLKGPVVTYFLQDIVRCYKSLENLWVENSKSPFVQVLEPLQVSEFNLKLKHLTIINGDGSKVVICSNIMTQFIKWFCKLETLVVTKNISTHFYNIEVLMKELSLKEIVLDSRGVGSVPKLMEAFKNYGMSLRFISLENFKGGFDVEDLGTYFEGRFPIVELKDGILILRKNEKIFHNNKDLF